MYQLKDRFFLSIKIDGKEVPVNFTSFGSIQLSSAVPLFLPMARIELVDNNKIFQNYITLADGVEIRIVMTNSPESSKITEYKFRLFQYIATQAGKGIQYIIDCIYDAPKYFNENSTIGLTGTSSTVLKKLASNCGLTFEGTPTNDSQIWTPLANKTCVFAKDIALHGYSNDRSCMLLCVDLSGRMKYIDYSQIKFDPRRMKTFMSGKGDGNSVYAVRAKKDLIKSGLLNNYSGYKFKTVEQDVTRTANVHTKVETRAMSSNLMVNAKLNQRLSGSRIQFTPVGCGNVHPNFHRAEHQNLRIKSLQSQGVLVAVTDQTEVTLLDPVQYAYVDTSGSNTPEQNTLKSGNYVVTAKTIYATGRGIYYEKFELTSSGQNGDPSGNKSQLSTK